MIIKYIWIGFLLSSIIVFVVANIYTYIKETKEEAANRDKYDAKALECQKYIYRKFNINSACDDCRWNVERRLRYMSNREFLIPRDNPDVDVWVNSLEIVCEVYKEVFAYYESEEYQLLLKYKTGTRFADHLLLPKKIKDDVKRKCEDLGVSVY